MPNSQSQNGHSAPAATTQSKKSSTALSMLRKTKNRTYGAFRSSANALKHKSEPNAITGHEIMNEDDIHMDSNSQRCTPKTTNGYYAIQPSNSFYFSPQSSWDKGAMRMRSETGAVNPHGRDNIMQEDVERTVANVESTLRTIVMCCAVFIAGMKFPEYGDVIQKILELSIVAWGTCLVIIGLVWFQKIRLKYFGYEEQEVEQVDALGPPEIQRTTAVLSDPSRDITMQNAANDSVISAKELTLIQQPSLDDAEVAIAPPPSKTTPSKLKEPLFMPPHLHQLEDLYIMLIGQQERLSPNGTAIKIETDLFEGEMLLMFRTSDVDDPPPSAGEENPISSYFRGKQRRFEFQWQIRLKKVPNGDVFVGCELDEPPSMGMIQRALVNTALKFVKKTNQGFGYYFSDSSESPSYLSFPVGTSMDRFVATEPGGIVPELGKEIYEDPETMKKRKRGGTIEWNTENTYTMALWSAYFDWINWQILNFPGIRPFSATSVAGVQPIKVNLYTISNGAEDEVSSENPPRDVLFALEVSNSARASLGKEAKAWKTKQTGATARVLKFDEEGSLVEEDMDEQNSEDEDEDVENVVFESQDVDPTIDNIDRNNYVTSGTYLSLLEGTGSFLASGGGYALLQSSSTSVIVLEKIFRSKKAFSYIQKPGIGIVSDPQMVIRNGDAVRVKLINISSNTTKYLRIHRGWWLRWTNNRPTKTSSFYISTNSPEATALSLGSPFSLRSRRWPNYHVGVCHESSAKFGGRMLAMYKAGKSQVEEEPTIECDEDDDPIDEDDDKDFIAEKPVNNTTMPLLLCAEVANNSPEAESPSPSKRTSVIRRQLESQDENTQSQVELEVSDFTSSQYLLDCQVWLEVMNRATRLTQLVYAIRVKETLSKQTTEPSLKSLHRKPSEASETEEDSGMESQDISSNMSVKLRCGKEVAPILNLGAHQKAMVNQDSLAWHITNLEVNEDVGESGLTSEFTNSTGLQRINSFSSSSDESEYEVMEDEPTIEIAGPNEEDLSASAQDLNETNTASGKLFHDTQHVTEDEENLPAGDKNAGVEFAGGDGNAAVSNDVNAQTDSIATEVSTGDDNRKKSKTKVLNKVAKTVKSSTVITGKQVIKQSKKVGKATVNTGLAAGRAIPNAYKPPKKHEPGGRFSSKKGSKNNSMKYLGRAIKSMEGQYCSEIHSGQLTAPDLSREQISQILYQLSMNKSSAVLEGLASFVKASSEHDLAFLRGSSAELGVIPLKAIDAENDYDCIVARGIWEGRWREECCVVYGKDNHLAFYAPLTRKPTLVVTFEEILSVRKCHPKAESDPLPGLSLLSIDTIWRCHYLAFLNTEEREKFLRIVNDAMYHAETKDPTKQTRKIAQEWESYKMSLETSLTGSGGKWAPVMVGKKSKQKRQRMILNSKRMTFDLQPVVEHGNIGNDATSKMGRIAKFVEELLRKALSLSPEALDSADSSFLKEVSRLRCIPLHEIDYGSKEALCIFVNLYHCLLQHSLLLAVDGLPDKRSVTRFKRCSCYEIGGDVFSLAELECCVIRGKLSRAVNLKSPLVDAAKKSRPYLQYALDAADSRVNFFVNTGSIDYPSKVPILRSKTMERQIHAASSMFLMDQVEINAKKRLVTIPKVCDVYRNDFGMGDCLVCLSQILRYLDEVNQLSIASLLENGGQITVKFKQASDRFHPSLDERPYDGNYQINQETSM